MVKRYELNDAQWQKIAALLPGKSSAISCHCASVSSYRLTILMLRIN